jgi:hypothetical protein
VHERLAKQSNRIDPATQGKIRGDNSHPDSNGHAGKAPGRDLPPSRADLHRD